MAISVHCGGCDKAYQVVDALAGKLIKCPKCFSPVRVAGPKPVAVRVTGADEDDDNVKAAPGGGHNSRTGRRRDQDDDDNIKDAPPGDVPESAELPDDVRELLEEELTKGEKIVWVGKPDEKVVFGRSGLRGLSMILIGLVVGAVVARDALKGQNIATGLLFLAVPLIFVVVGAGQPFVHRKLARNTCYVLTNRRAIVWQIAFFATTPKPTNYYPHQLVKLRREGSWMYKNAGDVIFRTEVTITTTHYHGSRTGRYMGSDTSKSWKHFGFLAVRNDRAVEAMIRETLVNPLLDKINS